MYIFSCLCITTTLRKTHSKIAMFIYFLLKEKLVTCKQQRNNALQMIKIA